MAPFMSPGERLARLISVINRVAEALAATQDLTPIFRLLADEARALLGAQATLLYQLSADRRLLHGVALSMSGPVPPGELMVPGDRGMLAELLQAPGPVRIAHLAQHAAHRGFPAGHPPVTHLLAVPLRDPAGLPVGLLMASDRLDGIPFEPEDEEIARTLALQAGIAVARAQAQRSTHLFLTRMGHALRTPLNAVIGFSGTLGGGHHGPLEPAQRDALGRIQRNGQQLLALIEDLLLLARLDAHQLPLDRRLLELPAPIMQAMGELAPAAHGQGIRLLHELAPAHVLADADVLGQALGHLLRHVALGEAAREVRLLGACEGEHYRLEVLVPGVELAPEELPGLFDPAAQVARAQARGDRGTGMELPISARLVHQLGGQLVATNAPGCLTYVLTLPLVAAAPRTLLLVDDVEDHRVLAGILLRRAGYEVHEAVSGREAVERVRAQAYRAVLMDLTLPGELDGWAVARRLTAEGAPPLVALTGHVGIEDRVLAAGFAGCLTKPLDVRTFVSQLEEILAHARR